MIIKNIVKTVFSIFGLKITKIRTVEGIGNYHLNDLLPFLNLDNEAVIIDGGANEGQTVNLLLKHSENFNIFCFEPDPNLFENLNKEFSDSENIKIFDQALSDVEKVHEFNIYKSTLLSSINQLNASSNQASPLVKTVTVKGTTLDKFVNDIGIHKIDLLKLDLQGFEYKALQGARNLLKQRRIKWVFAEIMLGSMYGDEGNENLFGVMNLLHENYEIYSMVDFNYEEKMKFSHCDILFKLRTLSD